MLDNCLNEEKIKQDW